MGESRGIRVKSTVLLRECGGDGMYVGSPWGVFGKRATMRFFGLKFLTALEKHA